MKKALLLVVFLVGIGSTAFAQVYLLTEGSDKFILKSPSEVSLISEAESFTALVNEHVEQIQTTENIRVVDSVVLHVDINEEGKASTIKTAFGYSEQHIDELSSYLKTLKFKNSISFTVSVVYPPLNIEVFETTDFETFPDSELCKWWEEDNLVFKVACYKYFNDRSLARIPKPDQLSNKKVEGFIESNLCINQDGKVIQISFSPRSFSSELNSFIISQLDSMLFLKAGTIGAQSVNYNLAYEGVFMDLKSGANAASSYIQASRRCYVNKEFFKSIFFLTKAKATSYKLSEQDVDYLASAYLLLGDTAKALHEWLVAKNEKNTERKKLVPVKTGNRFTAEWKEEATKDVSEATLNFSEVDQIPIFPGCKKAKTKEAQFECLNRGLMTHIAKNFKIPEEARVKRIGGKMFVNFVIENDGTLSNVVMAHSVHPLIDIAALRVVSSIPSMEESAVKNGKAVRMMYTVPINVVIR